MTIIINEGIYVKIPINIISYCIYQGFFPMLSRSLLLKLLFLLYGFIHLILEPNVSLEAISPSFGLKVQFVYVHSPFPDPVNSLAISRIFTGYDCMIDSLH